MIQTVFKHTQCIAIRFFDVMGPVVLSALSVFFSFCCLQPIAVWLDPSFSLLANRGVGKIAFTLLVIFNIIFLLMTLSREMLSNFFKTNLFFICHRSWIKPFTGIFLLFSMLHVFTLWVVVLTGLATFNTNALSLIIPRTPSLLFGFIATFFLAWTEEAIFRGALFSVLRQKLAPLGSMIITSLIFMLAHDLTNPFNLISYHWQLGLGLFLLGLLLNLLFFMTGKLYIGMGAHAGLVFIKVFLRRVPLIEYSSTTSFLFNPDLRQSIIVHILFVAVIIFLLIISRKKVSN